MLFYVSLLAGLLTPGLSEAGQWYDEPSVTVRLGYDDNVRFRENNEDESFRQSVSAQSRFGYHTEINDFNVNFRALFDRFSEESDLDTDNQYLDLNGKHRSGLHLFGFKGKFIRDTSRTSELETDGRVDQNKRRYSALLNPTWTATFNELTSAEFGYTFNKVIYEDSRESGLFDYHLHSFQGTLFRTWDELTQLSATVRASRFKVPNNSRLNIPNNQAETETNGVAIQFGVRRSLSETLTASLALGGRITNTDTRNVFGNKDSDTNTGVLINASLEKQFESTRINARALRELRPSGSGQLLDTKSIGIDLSHDLSERLAFLLDTSLFRNKREVDDARFNDDKRTYFVVHPRLRWRLTRWWDLTGSYRYRYQKYDERDDSAQSNAFFLSLTYNWPRESVARWSEI